MKSRKSSNRTTLQNALIEALCAANNITAEELIHPSRGKEAVAHTRMVGMWMAKAIIGMSGDEIAELFGREKPSVARSIRIVRGCINERSGRGFRLRYEDTLRELCFILDREIGHPEEVKEVNWL